MKVYAFAVINGETINATSIRKCYVLIIFVQPVFHNDIVFHFNIMQEQTKESKCIMMNISIAAGLIHFDAHSI